MVCLAVSAALRTVLDAKMATLKYVSLVTRVLSITNFQYASLLAQMALLSIINPVIASITQKDVSLGTNWTPTTPANL